VNCESVPVYLLSTEREISVRDMSGTFCTKQPKGEFLAKRYLTPLLLWASSFCGGGWAVGQEVAETAAIEHFEKYVRPLLIERCFECHSQEERRGGLALDSAAAMAAGGDSGRLIVPHEPEASLLVEAISYRNEHLQMPPDGRLSDVEIERFVQWIRLGAPDPRAESTASGAGESEAGEQSAMTSSDVTGAAAEAWQPDAEGSKGKAKLWSLQPLADPQLPAIAPEWLASHAEWPESEIDYFIAEKLAQANLSPAPPADRRELIRRVTFDLTGLPPTPEEVAAFVEDPDPQAFSRVVDRLLSSPRYGERWGRHWLDVTRYADSNGLDENLAYGQAWRYRDYVVDAFNSDLAYDQFVVEQLAGDLLPYANQATKTATGFLALGAKVLAEPDREKLTMDTIDEQIDTLGKALLGITLGCARCHDHKFDPVSQRDYYALAAIFRSTNSFANSNTGAIKHWYEHSFTTPDEKQQLAAADQAIAAKRGAASKFKNEAYEAIRRQAISDAARYLAASAGLAGTAPFAEVKEIAEQRQLHAYILFHCRQHLRARPDGAVEQLWHDLVDQGTSQPEIESRFSALFAAANREATESPTQQEQPATAQPKQENSDNGETATEEEPTFDSELLVAAKETLSNRSGLISLPPQPEYTLDANSLEQYYALLEETRVLESAAPDETAAMGVVDGRVWDELPIHIRGSHNNLGEAVAREFPHAMRYSEVRPVFRRDQSGRLELARWIASSQHPLTARVVVNRIWHWHFGQGLVATPENFGMLGDRPSHPELLDWLARRFIASGWSIKELHRTLLLSSVYRQASVHPEADAHETVDAENRLVWRWKGRRLEAEQLRDAVLAVAGTLDLTIGGKTVPLRNRQFVFDHTSIDHTRYGSHRRALYLPVIRNNLYTLFTQFDFPDPTTPTTVRQETVVAPQSLLLMNDPLLMEAGNAFARRLLREIPSDAEQRIDAAFRQAYGRSAEATELVETRRFLDEMVKLIEAEGDSESRVAAERAWGLFCHGLLASNEFSYLP
jgi:hypothetical protein